MLHLWFDARIEMRKWRGCRVSLIWFAACLVWGAPLGAQDAPTESIAARSKAADIAGLRRFELGVNFADIRTDCINSIEQKGCGLPSFGVGAGASYNLTGHFAIDGNFTVTPTTSNVATNIYGGRHAEYLAGLRSEARAQHYGYFLRTQIGMLSWNHVITQAIRLPNDQLDFLFGDQRKFAANAAAGFEYSPSPRIHFRGEIGDLLRPIRAPRGKTICRAWPGFMSGWESPWRGSHRSTERRLRIHFSIRPT